MRSILVATAIALELAALGAPASAQHQHEPGMEMPAPKAAPQPEQTKPEKAPVDHAQMGHGAMPAAGHAGHAGMTDALGPYPLARGKVSLGAVRDFRIAKNLSLGAGGLLAVNFVPDGLAPLYGGHNPIGAMGFVRLKLD